MKKSIILGLVIILVIILAGCTEKPICGNGIIEEGETMQTCCEDVGCLGEQTCQSNQCVEPTCESCQYLDNNVCQDYECCEDQDCDDNNSNTVDICLDSEIVQSSCGHDYICNQGQIDWEAQPNTCNLKFKPFYCDGETGNLIENCSLCGCEEGTKCSDEGNCYVETCGGEICSEQKECINDKCILKYTPYKLGLVYVYDKAATYNPNWRTEIEAITQKVENALKDLSENKIDASIEILGEVQTDVFCWNPATVGGTFRNVEIGSEHTFRMPGSMFSSTGIGLTGFEIVESNCDNCVVQEDIYRISCDDDLTYHNLWETNKLNELNEEISQELGFDFEDYDGVYIIFGRLGQILPEEQTGLEYRCTSFGSVIGGYANLIMAENSINAGGLVDCSQFGAGSFYDKLGWHQMVHEILHRFGAIDVYETGPIFGTKTEREQALAMDSRTDESIMGNDYKSCMEDEDLEKDGRVCFQEELESVYLDKFNRQKIGITS